MPAWSAILAGLLSGILPTGTAEVAAIAIGTIQPPRQAMVLLLLFTVAHVAAKVPWYWLGMHADRVTARWPRAQAQVVRARSFLASRPAYGLGILAAASFASVPPFHVAAIAAGIVRFPLLPFVTICLAGRTARFLLLGAGAGLVRQLVA